MLQYRPLSRFAAMAVATVTGFAAAVTWTGLADASQTYQVANTGGANLNVHSEPQLSAPVVGQLAAGQSVTIACQTTGDEVNGTSDIWDQLAPGRYVSDYYVNTPVVGSFTQGIPSCSGSAPAPPAPAPSSPSLEQVAEGLDGVNWADARDNFVSGWVIPTGLSASDSYDTIYAKATAILQGFQSAGATTVRLPINTATVLNSSWWPRYRAAIDAASALGMKVILSYWDSNNSGTIDAPADGNATSTSLSDYPSFELMWTQVIADYGSKSNIYFEIMNEPDGYNASQWDSLAEQWLQLFPDVPADHVIVSAARNRSESCVGWMQNDLSLVASDPKLAGTLLSVHFYNWCSGLDDAFLFDSLVAPYVAHGVVIDEFGTNVVANGAPVRFGRPSTDSNVSYLQDLTSNLHGSGVGAVYWPGLRGGDSYSVWSLTSTPQWWQDGVDPLTPNGNGSILALLKQAWT